MINRHSKRIASLLLIAVFACISFYSSYQMVSAQLISNVMDTIPAESETIASVNTSVATEEETEVEVTGITHVQDMADILSYEEEISLRDECNFVGEAHNIDIIILTTDYTMDTRKAYLEDFYDAHYPQITDAVLILVDMDPSNRGVEIQGYGQCEFYISDDRIEQILDNIVPFLSAGAYYDAFYNYINQVDNYMAMEAGSDYVHTEQDNLTYNEDYYEEAQISKQEIFKQKTLFNLFIAAVVGAISVGIMLINSKGKITVNSNTYRDPKNTRILGHWDRYIRTTTTRTRKPENNNSGGGGFGGGGVSRGGHSHSGGGRGF